MRPLLRRTFVLPVAALVIFVILAIGGCTPTAQPTAMPTSAAPTVTPTTPPPSPTLLPTPQVPITTTGVIISELVPGVAGVNNNLEFIELYNAGVETVALKGWSLWYQMTDQQEAKRLIYFNSDARIPGHGHYLLVRAGESVGVLPDAVFEVPLFERWGGLQLRDAEGEVVDALAWGDKAPASYMETSPAAAPEGGASLERAPGGDAGNAQDANDGAKDFTVREMPLPQNSGMAPTPLPASHLTISVTAPVTVSPGSEFALSVTVQNLTDQALGDMRVVFPLPESLTFVALASQDGAPLVPLSSPEAPVASQDVPEIAVVWAIEDLAPGGSHTALLTLQSPWRYGPLSLRGYYVRLLDRPLPGDLVLAEMFGPFLPLTIEGGAIPVATARTLVGEIVTIEGVATMYTGGFYSGSTGTKFYLEDKTGGVQVYCPDAKGIVSADIGDRVRVTGKIEIYRDSVEIIPQTYPDDVEDLGASAGDEGPAPLVVSAYAATHDEALLGRLIEVEGQVIRFEEFSYSYEFDLLDAQGDTVLVYLDKDTYVNPEFVETGDTYRITGISEIYDGQWQLKPRLVTDFRRVYPPELVLDLSAQNSIAPGGLVTYTLRATNHTTGTLTNVTITASPAYPYVTLISAAEEDAVQTDAAGNLSWSVGAIAPEGGMVIVTYTVQVSSDTIEESFEAGATVTAAEWPGPVVADPWLTFVGEGVPIWAIQGAGGRSPFVLSEAATAGVVTGVFPEQDGFWIQSLEPDEDPATSEGLFVLSQGLALTLTIGDYVKVTGRVRERSGQTLLNIAGVDAIEIVETGVTLPPAVELDPPQDDTASRAYYEALEGMLVAVSEPVIAVGPTSKYGETPLVRATWGIDRVMKGEPKGLLIFADDGSDAAYTDRSQMPYAVKTGDQVSNLVGPLAFTYENYKVQPILTPTITATDVTAASLAPVDENAFSVATFNVENMFDIFNPHPTDPERPNLRAYETDLAKVAETVAAMGAPIIVGLQEVENIGILEDLVAQPAIAAYGYVPVLMEGFDSRGIDVGYLVRGDRATVKDTRQYPAPEGLTSRPPLMIAVSVRVAGHDESVYVLNNHFTSMSGGELATEPRRLAQAQWNAEVVRGLQEEHPGAHVIILGDLNSFYDSPPLDALRIAGLHHIYEFVEPGLPYTYIYQGESETLDHILVTPALYEGLVRVEALHVNADYPLPVPGDTSAQGASDHDPLIAVFELK